MTVVRNVLYKHLWPNWRTPSTIGTRQRKPRRQLPFFRSTRRNVLLLKPDWRMKALKTVLSALLLPVRVSWVTSTHIFA